MIRLIFQVEADNYVRKYDEDENLDKWNTFEWTGVCFWLIYYKGWPIVHGRVILETWKTWLVQWTLLAYTSVTFYKVPEQHGHV